MRLTWDIYSPLSAPFKSLNLFDQFGRALEKKLAQLRRPGGRLATRRSREGGFVFDHGAQYVTARSAGFRALIERMAASGDAAAWQQAGADEPHWVGVGGMDALAGHLERALVKDGALISAGRHVAHLQGGANGWRVRHLPAAEIRPGMVTDQGGKVEGPFDAVLLALPAPQSAALLDSLAHGFATVAESVPIAPCWAVMAAFAERVPWPDQLRPEYSPLSWIARDSSRPGRDRLPDCWVMHASPDWSRANLERPAAEIAQDLLAVFREITGVNAEPIHLAAHRWRHALTEAPLDRPFLWDGSTRLGVCGDWCVGARVEAAWISGTSLAEALLASSNPLASVTADV